MSDASVRTAGREPSPLVHGTGVNSAAAAAAATAVQQPQQPPRHKRSVSDGVGIVGAAAGAAGTPVGAAAGNGSPLLDDAERGYHSDSHTPPGEEGTAGLRAVRWRPAEPAPAFPLRGGVDAAHCVQRGD